jgi:phenylacetyl-CoA:acceptor oxidoreductase subunit 1
MTRWAMVADLRRCVGCQTCTAACKHANATPPGVQWRRVLDMEVGEYPDVQRAFVPGGLPALRRPALHGGVPQHGHKKARRRHRHHRLRPVHRLRLLRGGLPLPGALQDRRADSFAYGRQSRARDASAHDDARIGVATKCTFCVDRIDSGLAQGLTPGRRPRGHAGLRQRLHRAGAGLRRHRRPGQQRVAGCWPRTRAFACTRNWAPAPASTTCGTTRTAATRRTHHELRPQPLAAAELGRTRRRQLHRRRCRLRAAAVQPRWPARRAGCARR